MKRVEAVKKFRSMKKIELNKELVTAEKKYNILRLSVSSGKEKQYSKIKLMKKDIARIKTILKAKNEKE